MKIIIGMCGASGTEYAVQLLKALKEEGHETHLISSEWAETLIKEETSHSPEEIKKLATKSYSNDEMDAGISSTSFPMDAMVVIPATMKTVSEIATAHSGTLIARCAENMLRTRKKLIVCLRETPISALVLENLHKIALAGGIVFPLCPGFYHKPKTLQDQFDFIIGKILDLLGIENKKFRRWKA